MQKRRSKAISWFLSLIMALTIFSVPTSIFAAPEDDSPAIDPPAIEENADNQGTDQQQVETEENPIVENNAVEPQQDEVQVANVNPEIEVNEANFPDQNFRDFLINKYDIGAGEQFDFSTVKKLNVSDRGIESLEGIENFTSLIELDCSFNEISSFGEGELPSTLRILNCSHNRLTELTL